MVNASLSYAGAKRVLYVAPAAEIFEINAVKSIMDASPVSRDGDNERTGEEDLF